VSYECACDYDPPSIYNCTPVKAARKEHQCEECRRTIRPGEPYELVWGMWDGRSETFKTCSHCLALRDWVKAHVPCFCWAHGNIREDALETARGYAHEAPGLLFGAYRREIAIKREGASLPHPKEPKE
jgi:hypothetical protein